MADQFEFDMERRDPTLRPTVDKEVLDLAKAAGIDVSQYAPPSVDERVGFREVTEKDREATWGDYGRALGAAGLDVVGGIGAATEYATRGAIGGDTRRFFGESAEEVRSRMSPAGQQALSAEFLPKEGGVSVLDNFTSSMGLKSVSMIPSFVTAVIPGGIVGSVLRSAGASVAKSAAAAAVTAKATSGVMNAGEVASQIYNRVEKLPDEELRRLSPAYDNYRFMMSEKDARQEYMRDVAGAAPAAAFLLSYALGGLEGQVAGRIAGAGPIGFGRGALKGGLAEGKQEFGESAGGEYLSQSQLFSQIADPMNWQKILSQGLEGLTLGAFTGATIGGITNIGGTPQEAPPPPGAGAATTEVTTPEAADTIQAQQEKLVNGEVPAMLFPVGTQELAVPEGLARVERPEGVVHYDPREMTAQQAQRLPINEILGYVQPKEEVLQRAARGEPATVVAETTPAGREVRAAAVSATQAPAQAQLFEQTATPGNRVVETTPESIQRNRGLDILSQRDEETLQGYRDLRDSTPVYPTVTPGEARSVRGDRPVRMTREPSRQERLAAEEEYDQYLAEQRVARQAEQEARQAEEAAARRVRMQEGMTKAERAIAVAKARAEAARPRYPEVKQTGVRTELPRTSTPLYPAGRFANFTTEPTAKQKALAAARAREETAAAAAAKKAEETAATKKPKPPAKAPAKKPIEKISGFWVSQAEKRAEEEAARAGKQRGVGTGKRSPEEKARTAQMRADARKAFEENAPGEDELYGGKAQTDLFRRTKQEPSRFVQTKEQAAALKKRLERIVAQAEKARELPQSIREGQTDFVLFARMAKDAITYYVGKTDAASLEKTNAWVADELAARAGDFEPMRKRRLEEGYAAKQRQASADEMIETAGTGDTGRRIVAATTTADIQEQLDQADEAARFEMALERLQEMLSVSRELTREQIQELADIAGREVADFETFQRALSSSPALEMPRIQNEEFTRQAMVRLFDAMTNPTEIDALSAARMRRTIRLAREAPQKPYVIELSDGTTMVRGGLSTDTNPVYVVPQQITTVRDALSGTMMSLKAMGQDSDFTPIHKYIAGLIERVAGDVKVYILRDADMDKIGYATADGINFRSSGSIYVRASAIENPERGAHVVFHESAHAALVNRVIDDPLAIGQIEAIAREVQRLRGYLQDAYAFYNAQEFLAEALSNVNMQYWLMQTPISPELAVALDLKAWRGRSLWWGLLNRFARWLGMERFGEAEYSAMHAIMSVAERLSDNRPPRFARGWSEQFPINYDPRADEYTLSPYWAQKVAEESARSNQPGTLALRKQELLSGVSDRAAATSSWLSRVAIVGSTLDQLRQQYAGLFTNKDGTDLLAKVVQAMQEQAPYARVKKQQADLLAQDFIRFTKKNATEAADLVDIMIDATMSNVRLGKGANNTHLDKGWRGIQGKTNLSRLQKEYAALSPEAQALYQKMAKFYRDTQNEMTRGTIGNVLDELGLKPKNREDFITRVMTGTMTPADETLLKDKPTALKAFKDANEMRVIQGDYFPLMRQGDYVVVTTDNIKDLMGGKEISPGKVEFRARTRAEAMKQANAFIANTDLRVLSRRVVTDDAATTNDFGVIVTVQRNGVFFFERESDARKWARENAGDYDQVSDVMPRRETGAESRDLTVAQFNALMGAINRQEDAPEATKDTMRGIIEQAAARMMSGNRVQKQRIARRNVEGASKDFARNLLLYGQSTSGYLAKLRYAPQVRAALKEMTEVSKDYMDKHAATRVRLLNELNKRVDDGDTGATEPPRWMRDLMTVTYLSKLFSPMYSVVNGMQPWMVTYPVLAGRYGNIASWRALQDSYKAIGFFGRAWDGLVNTGRSIKDFNDVAFDTRDVVGSIKKNLAKEKDGAELVQLIDMLLQRGAMSDAGFELSQSIAEGRGKVGTAFSHVDRVARQMPQTVEEINRAVAAIAAYRLAKSRPNVSAEKARAAAFDIVMNTQGDYSGGNAPRFFNNPILRPALQFKKYAQMMTYLLVDATYRSFDGKISSEERAIARKQLLNIFAVQIMMAGMLSLPGIEIAKMAFMIAAAFGFGEGWDDQEEKLRKLADETFGKTWGELISRGVVSRALNIDLSKRLSLADMWTFGEPKKYDKENLSAYAFNLAFGAPGGTVMDVVDGFRKVGDGEMKTGFAQMLPVKVIADGLRAANGYSEGKVTNVELAMNIFGVRSGRQAEKSEEIGSNIRKMQDMEATYKKLSRQYLRAQTAGERALLRARIAEHNKVAPLRYKVFPNALDRRRAQNEKERVN